MELIVHPEDLEQKMEHLERIVSAVQKMIEPLDDDRNLTDVRVLNSKQCFATLNGIKGSKMV